jgi:4-amino-4-deoxy-L-arabinose transferase-like glycosyltransferase
VTRRIDAQERAPISVTWLFAPVFAAVTLLHLTLLRLPYFWDEGGYYIPAAWDFFRLGTVIPVTTVRNAHPPLPSVAMAAWWKVFGFHILSTRLLMCVVTTFALLAVFKLARMFAGQTAAFAVLVLTAIYPVWFAQSTLAHADMFAAAFTLWALGFYADRPGWTLTASHGSVHRNAVWIAVLFSLACMAKETAIVIPAALFCFEVMLLADRRPEVMARIRGKKPQAVSSLPNNVGILRSAQNDGRLDWQRLIALMVPALVLVLWYVYHHWKTGFTFGNPEYLRYNATANISVQRVLSSLRHRLVHLTTHMNLFLPVIAAVVIFLLPSRTGKPILPKPALRMIAVLLVAQWIAFSVLGGALLTRYLLPAYPLLLIVCVAAWQSRMRRWPLIAALTLVAFGIGCEVNPPYPFAPEDNLAYRDMIVVHQHAIDFVMSRYPQATVLTAWPVLADLQRPELGYLKTSMKTAATENFSSEELRKATVNPASYDVVIVFSTKYDPPVGGLNLAGHSREDDKRFYDWHADLLPGEAAAMLHGQVVWEEDRKGEWAAVITFPRGYDVRLRLPFYSMSSSRKL